VRVQLSVVPTAHNHLDLHAYTFTTAGLPRDVAELTATAALPKHHIDGIPVKFVTAGPGHFVANQVTLPTSGQWTMDLRIRTDAIDEYTTSARITVR
jgi:copper transport protein